jgi:hypothetical protein
LQFKMPNLPTAWVVLDRMQIGFSSFIDKVTATVVGPPSCKQSRGSEAMVINLTPQLEAALSEQARRRGIAPEVLALDALRDQFLPKVAAVEPQDDWERRLFGAAIDCGVFAPANTWVSDRRLKGYTGMSTKRKRAILKPSTARPATLPQPTDPEAKAAEQGVKPIRSIDELRADFWPEDESIDDLLAAVRQWRREGQLRSKG